MPRSLSSILLSSILALTPHTASSINPRATLDQLKTLEITCYVPTWLAKGFKQKRIRLTYDEPGPDEGSVGRFPRYFIEYSDNAGGSFTIESARKGIGDRNIVGNAETEETTITSPFGPMHLVYTPNTASSGSGRIDDIKSHPQGEVRGATKFVKVQGKAGRKKEIRANWVADPNMKSEKAKDPQADPRLGRYHGFSATGITVAEFEKIIHSLKPIRQ